MKVSKGKTVRKHERPRLRQPEAFVCGNHWPPRPRRVKTWVESTEAIYG
jgi:hypothetical protein